MVVGRTIDKKKEEKKEEEEKGRKHEHPTMKGIARQTYNKYLLSLLRNSVLGSFRILRQRRLSQNDDSVPALIFLAG